MKSATFALVLMLLSLPTAFAAHSADLDLMPLPAGIEQGQGRFAIEPDLAIALTGEGATPRLERGLRRMMHRLASRSAIFFEPASFGGFRERGAASVQVKALREGKLVVGENEQYSLTVAKEGIRLEAETDIGALRGLETLLQLLQFDSEGAHFSAITIEDSPRFPWRGLMIDSSRHFMPLEVLKRNLDGMAAVKLNVLHWHLIDDQGFRVESRAFPRLHELGSDGEYYTQTQIREVIEYAADRGIRVVPEFDLPGHATALLTAYPELGSAPGPYEIENNWGIMDPAINPVIEQTYEFLDTFFAEMAALFGDEFMHIGGDENNGKHWKANPEIVAYMEANGYEEPLELQRYFNERVLEIFSRHGKRMIGWDEILQKGLPKNIVIHSWRGRDSLFEAARQGYAGILSNGYYIDLIHPTSEHYLNDPLPDDSGLSEDEAARVLGGEATMWAEYVSPETVDSRIWPRTAAIAERFWSPGHVRDLESMYQRLDRISLQLEDLGLLHERNRPVMLRRLCQCRDTTGLEVLLGAIEPVKVYNRGQQRKHTRFSPLTRMVDAAWPDAKPAREFAWAVDRLIESGFGDAASLEKVKTALVAWQQNHARIRPQLESNPALAEIKPMSIALEDVATIGLEALEIAGKGSRAQKPWLDDSLKKLEASKAPHAQTELAIVEPISRLLTALRPTARAGG
jgi:hexosaminidase